MILSLVSTLIGLTLALWLMFMYVWWRKEEHDHVETPGAVQAVTYWEKSTRLLRRAFYFAEMQVKRATLWSNKRFTVIFFKVFPNAEPAFAKRDPLTGLKDGPSSLFLLSITEDQKKPRRRRSA